MKRFASAFLLVASVMGGEETLRFVGGVPVGGPPPMASAVEWTIGHYTGDANAEVFAAHPDKRLEYVVNLAGRHAPVAWADRVVIEVAGRTPATCLLLSDGDPGRRAATVEAWISEGTDASGAAAFALGIDGASQSFSKRARTDLPARRARPMACPGGVFAEEISRLTTRRRQDGYLVPQIGEWDVFLVEGDPPRVVAAQQRSLRFLRKAVRVAQDMTGTWGCVVVSGFPAPSKTKDVAVMPFVAWRLATKAGERLLLVQVYEGAADAVERLGVVALHDDGRGVDRRGEAWSWNGADWQHQVLWSARSDATRVAVGVQP